MAVFSGFVALYLGEKVRWNHLAAFLCILAAVGFTFLPDKLHAQRPLDPSPAPAADPGKQP